MIALIFAIGQRLQMKGRILFSEREWSKWYEKNTQREEKSFVYRKSGKNSEPVDEEDLEVRERFV